MCFDTSCHRVQQPQPCTRMVSGASWRKAAVSLSAAALFFGDAREHEPLWLTAVLWWQAYYILDELIMAGELQETSKKAVLRVVAAQVTLHTSLAYTIGLSHLTMMCPIRTH